MNPTMKKLLTAVAVKEGIDRIQQFRRPKRRSFVSRIAPVAIIAAIGGATYYLVKSGKAQPIIEGAKSKMSGQSSSGSNGYEVPNGASVSVGESTPAGAPVV